MMQRKFKLGEPKREICVDKWVTVSNVSQQGYVISPRISVPSPKILENNFINEPILTPKSIKITSKPVFFRDDINEHSKKKWEIPISPSTPIETPTKVKYNKTGLVRDTKEWRLDSNRSSKLNLNLQSQRSLLSASSSYIDTSRILFKAEIKDMEVKNLVTIINENKNETEDTRIPPSFSARENGNLLPEEMSETVLQPRHEPDMSNKVGESRKEIEKLKTELEELINTTLKSKNVAEQHKSNENIENIPTSPKVKKVTPIKQKIEAISPSKTSKSPLSVRRKQSNTELSTTREESKSKSKTYDPETTREFIRKQKQRRKEKLQQEELKKKESEELKKQKLEELKEKSTKLIVENVKKSLNKKVRAKSEEKLSPKMSNAQVVNKNKFSVNIPQNNKLRAKSFDRLADKKINSDANVNKAKGTPTARSRSENRELKFCDKKPPVKSAKATKEASTKHSTSNLNPEEDLINVMAQISEELKRNELNNNKDETLKKSQTSLQSNNSNISSPNDHVSIKSNKNSPRNINLNKNVVELEKEPIISVKIQEQKIHISGDEGPRSAIPLNVRLEMIKNNSEVIVTPPKSPDVVNINEIVNKEEQPNTNEDALKEIEAIKQKLETSISQSNLERNETPAWLLPPSTLPYPYNFISAVRKKLEIATKSYNIAEKIHSPLKKDTSIQTLQDKEKTNVSIQCSIDKVNEISIPEIVPPKTEELKTFSSHKCRKQLVYNSPPKLKSPTSFKDISKELSKKDKHSVKNVLVEKKDKNSAKSKSKTVFAAETSDSDTTKNIPEISEEEQFPKSVKPNEFELVKNITFIRRSEMSNRENFTSDQMKVDKNSLNHKTKKVQSDQSDRLKNITFNRQTNNSDLNNLIKPDYKIDISKLSRKNSEHSNRSKYPSDIENILTQYSKMKLSSKSSAHNESFYSQYSDDFSSSPNNISAPKTKSYEQNPEKSSLDMQTETKTSTKINSSDLSKIKSEILASLARKHSSSTSNIPQVESTNKNSEINSDVESLKISSGSRLSRRSLEKILESISKKSPRSSEHNEKESLNKNSSKMTEIKTRNSNNLDSEINTSYNEIQSIPSGKEPTKSKISSKISEVKSRRSLTNSQSHNQTAANSHSKKEESTVASSIPESFAIKTESIQESNIIKSSFNNSFKEDTQSVTTDSTVHSKTDEFESPRSKSLLKSSNVPSLTKPAVNLKIENEKFFQESKNNPNQIHLKFQAEVHLLNSFNNSLQQVVAVEKSLLDIDQPNQPTSATVNFRRGCGAPEQIESLSVLEPSVCSQDLNMSHMSESVASETALSITVPQNDRSVLSETSISRKNPYVSVSLGMFDQMIRDEDNRLEYLKAFLKLRDKALFDRTKGELALLEIQKKQLRENGQLNDVTIIKKKQRGLIIKLEQERHEMQRLKQAHKQASKERKNALREQKNIIKQQLSSTDQIPSKIRRLSQLERRQSGPVKVYRVESRTEQVRETTMSRNSSGTDETTVSVTTSSVVTQISEKVSVDHSIPLESSMALKPYPPIEKAKSTEKHTEKVKRALLMKEADLEKRRKEAEEVLKWNERLKQEEAAVVELERQAKSIQLDDPDKKRILTGAHLNKIWKEITGFTEKKFEEHKKYQMSKRSLDKFYQNARKIFKEISEERSSSKQASEESYTSDFDSIHSPSKVNLSSSAMTQSNDSDTNISPNKMLSERLRKISEASRLDFITSSKKDSSASERTSNKNSMVSEVLPTDKQRVTESIHTLKDSSDEISSAVSGIESIISKKSVQSVVKYRRSSSDSDIPELQSVQSSEVKESIQTVDEVEENSKNLTESIVSEIKQGLIENKSSEIVEEKSTNISSESDLPELEIITEHVKSANIIDSVEEDISDTNIKSEYDKISGKLISETLISGKSAVSNISTEELKSDNYSEQKSSISNKSEIKSDNNEILESKAEGVHTTDKQISEILIQQKDNNLSENIVSEQVTPIKSEENTSKIVSENILSQSDALQSEPELKSVINTSSEIDEISKNEEIQENVTSKSHSETLPEKLSEHEKSSESKSEGTTIDDYPVHYRSQFEQYSEESISDHSDHQSDTKSIVSDHISTKHSIKSEFENEFIKSLSLENKTDKISDTTLKTEKSVKEALENIKSSEKSSIVESKSQDVKSRKTLSKTHSDSTIGTEKSLQEELLIAKTSEKSSIVDTKSQDFESRKTLSKSHSDATLCTEKSSQEDLHIAKSSGKSSIVELNTQDAESRETLSKTKSNTTLYTEKSLEEELQIAKSSEKSSIIESKSHDLESRKTLSKTQSYTTFDTEKSSKTSSIESKSQEFVESEKILNKSQIEEKESVSLLSEKLSSESPKECNNLEPSETSKSKIIENQKSESQIHSELDQKSEKESTLEHILSELSTPHESEPYYKTDFETKSETDVLSETKEKCEDFEKDLSTEKESEIKSSVEVETEKESEPITETKYSGTFISEKESTTVIETPKSTKENETSEVKPIEENSEVPVSPLSESQDSKKSSTVTEETFEGNKENSSQEEKNVSGVSHIDVRKRVSEILADTNSPRGDKSPRVQDLYVTTYDVATNSPESTPETGSPTNEYNKREKTNFSLEPPYRNEAEELLRKQLEIEQEIIQLERQQQQNIPYLFMREIPNKPPPPYKPPTAAVTPVINSVIPASTDQVRTFVNQSADVLFNAFVSGNLKDVSFHGDGNKVSSQRYVFDLCKEIALEICKPTEETYIPSWKTQKKKFQSLISKKPLSKQGLCSVMNRKVLQLLNFEPVNRKDNLIIRWSRKKRDHVDEILVLESQTEETEWTNYDSDEQSIKDNLTSDIMNMLISETAQVMCEILNKKKTMSWTNYC